MPKISVVTPTYERPAFLARLLASIAAQTYKDFEVIVVDDASACREENQAVIQDFRLRLPQLSYYRNEQNRGPCYTRNRGIAYARGEWIALVDDDDEWKPAKLEKQINRLQSTSRCIGIVYTFAHAICDGRIVHTYTAAYEGRPLAQLLKECFIPSPTVLVKKQALQKAGLFDETLVSCQDWDMWTRILACGYECAVVPSFEAFYHKHNKISVGGLDTRGIGHARFHKKHWLLYMRYLPFTGMRFWIKRAIS